MSYTIINGDCLVEMAKMPENSVDAIVTDPPYGLSSHSQSDIIAALTAWLSGKEYTHSGKGFMGKEWDSFTPSPMVFAEMLRVLKPGGHLLCFAGSRTQDLMGIAIRLAGFEMRDCLQWIYAQGFPKSLNIGKAIKNEQYEGFGTALKPAYEPIILARKPLEKGLTVAQNVLKWGVGGINIDGCRIEGNYDNDGRGLRKNNTDYTCQVPNKTEGMKTRADCSSLGRFPANVLHDGSDEVEAAFAAFGESKSTANKDSDKRQNMGNSIFLDGVRSPQNSHSDSGSASRFFFSGKASKRDRDEGCEDMELKNNMRTNAPRINEEEKNKCNSYNFHPTVKPTALMRWLCRLITPPNGLILDPFMGSGSTGKAAILEGFNFTGIEISAEYCAIAEKRLADAAGKNEQPDENPPASGKQADDNRPADHFVDATDMGCNEPENQSSEKVQALTLF